MPDDVPPGRPAAQTVAEVLAVMLGLALLAGAIFADSHWFDRHFLPDMFSIRPRQMRRLWAGRAVTAALGLWVLVVLRPWLGRLAARRSLRQLAMSALPTLAAVILAICASELILRSTPWRAAHEAKPTREPLRRRDPRLGWVYLTDRSAHGRLLAGRRILYAIDPHGYRAARPGDVIDPNRPSIVLTGESIIFGYGLSWDEAIAGQVERLTGLQAADIAVEAYAPDQAYTRLRDELPRFRCPKAVVAIFIPSLFGRILDDDRPHLDAGLVPRPETRRWRLATLARRAVPYRTAGELRRGLDITRAVLRSVAETARARGAVPILVVPVFLPEPPAETAIRRTVLDEAHIPYLPVRLDQSWRIRGDKHPDARGDLAIAKAIQAQLLAAGVTSAGC